MRRSFKILALFTLFVLLLTSGIFSQSAAGGATRGAASYTLTVNTSPGNASIFINGTQQKGNSFTLPAGQYTVLVKANGFSDYTTTVNLNQNMTISASLQPVTFALNVRSNVQGAQVFVNKAAAGQTNFSGRYPAGNYTIVVTMPGYQEYSTTVNLNRDTTITANLQPVTFSLTVRSNVPGAQVFVNKAAAGRTNFTGAYQPGTYTVQVSAQGYQDFITTVTLNQNIVIDATLNPLLATVNFVVPQNILDPRGQGSINQVNFFVNGQQVKGNSIQLPPGNHQIRISSGGLSVEQNVNLQSGQTYTITPTFGFMVQ